jgi:hypothetical protein
VIFRQAVGLSVVALTTIVVFRRGERAERLGVSIVAAGWLITPLVEQRESWLRPQYGIMIVDIVILAAFAVMTARFRRYWLILATAFQAIAVLVHLGFLLEPKAFYRAYFVETFAIGYLVLGSILGGVFIEARPSPAPRALPTSRRSSSQTVEPPSEGSDHQRRNRR